MQVEQPERLRGVLIGGRDVAVVEIESGAAGEREDLDVGQRRPAGELQRARHARGSVLTLLGEGQFEPGSGLEAGLAESLGPAAEIEEQCSGFRG